MTEDEYLDWAMQNEFEEQLLFEQAMDEIMGEEFELEQQYEQEMFEYMDSVFENECLESDNDIKPTTLLRDNNGSGVVTRRRTGSRIKRQQQMLSRKLHACNRQEYGLK